MRDLEVVEVDLVFRRPPFRPWCVSHRAVLDTPVDPSLDETTITVVAPAINTDPSGPAVRGGWVTASWHRDSGDLKCAADMSDVGLFGNSTGPVGIGVVDCGCDTRAGCVGVDAWTLGAAEYTTGRPGHCQCGAGKQQWYELAYGRHRARS